MVFNYPFKYSVMEVPPRCRKPRPVEYEAEHSVEIKEATATEAPVALIQSSKIDRYSDTSEWQTAHLRWYEGQLWVRRDLHDGRSNSMLYELNLPTEPRFVRYTWDHTTTKEGSIRWIDEWAAGKLLIDGDLWQPWPEPLLEIQDNWYGNRRSVSLRITPYDEQPGRRIWRQPLTRQAELEAALGVIADRRNFDLRLLENTRVLVLLPEVLQRKPFYYYRFGLGSSATFLQFEVEATSEVEALRLAQTELSESYPRLTLGRSDSQIIHTEIKIDPDEIGLHNLIGRRDVLDLVRGEDND